MKFRLSRVTCGQQIESLPIAAVTPQRRNAQNLRHASGQPPGAGFRRPFTPHQTSHLSDSHKPSTTAASNPKSALRMSIASTRWSNPDQTIRLQPDRASCDGAVTELSRWRASASPLHSGTISLTADDRWQGKTLPLVYGHLTIQATDSTKFNT